MSDDRPAVRAYRALVSLYPRRFRVEYGADMVQLVRDQCVNEPVWRVCARAVLDMGITIPAQHLEAHMKRPSTHLVPMLYAALAVGGLLLAIVGGSNTGVLAVGLSIAVVAGTTAAVAWRRQLPVKARTTTDGWWKLMLAGPCIVGAVIVAASLGVEAWMLGVFAVLVAFVLTGTGVLLGIVHFAKRHSRAIPT